jgi:hypothetical protein
MQRSDRSCVSMPPEAAPFLAAFAGRGNDNRMGKSLA